MTTTNSHTKNSITHKLESMVGNTYLYHTREVTIQDIAAANGQVKFITGGQPIVIEKSQLKDKLDDFLLVESAEETLPAEMESEVTATFRKADGKIQQLEEIILDNIQKVQNDKGYLEQARQVNKGVDTILKMNQQKIDLFREVRKTKLNIKK